MISSSKLLCMNEFRISIVALIDNADAPSVHGGGLTYMPENLGHGGLCD